MDRVAGCRTQGTKGDGIMRKSTRTIAVSAAAAALVLMSVTGCGQARPDGQSESTAVQTEAAPAVTEAPIVIQTEAPETQPPETQPPETQPPETQPPETQAPETQAPVTQSAVPSSLSEEEELNQLYEFAQEEIGTRFANADINVRTSTSTESADNIISSLDKGEEITVIGETANWYEVYKAEDSVTGLTDLKGFVMKAYVSGTYDEAMAAQPEETAPAQSAEPAPQEAAPQEAAPQEAAPQEAAPAPQENAAPAQNSTPASGPQVTVTSDANIRAEAREMGTVVGVVNAGTTVTQIGSADGWVQIDYNGVQGYIKASMVS